MDARVLDVSPVRGKAELRAFLGVPRRVYAGLPGFVAPLELERASVFSPGKAEVKNLQETALGEDQVCRFQVAMKDAERVRGC